MSLTEANFQGEYLSGKSHDFQYANTILMLFLSLDDGIIIIKLNLKNLTLFLKKQ